MSDPLTHKPTISDLTDPNAKTLFERLKMHCKWKTCLAISEMKLIDYRWSQVVNSLKANESAVFMRCEMPTSADWDIICALLLASTTSGQTVCYRIL